MYNGYGNVLKSYQINMGIPYQVKPKQKETVPEEKVTETPAAADKGPSPEAILENARKEAGKIIEEARLQAELIISSANEKVAARIEEEGQKAREEGYKYGESLARQHYQKLISEAEEIKQKAKEIHDNTISGLEGEIIELIIQIAKKVIGTELTQNSDVILGLIRNALSATSTTDKILICVSADDYDFVVENKQRVLEGIKGIRGIEIIKDNSLKKGECFIDTGLGTVDSSIEIQLEAVENTLRELLGQFARDESIIAKEENQ